MTLYRKTSRKDRLDYWVCPNCRRRHDLVPPMIMDGSQSYALVLKCDGCGNISKSREVLEYQKQQKRKSLPKIDQLIEAMNESNQELSDMRIRLHRIEDLLEKIEQK